MTAEEAQKYQAVELATLTAGMLVDRPLYVYLAGNDRYIQMCKPLHPLEERVLDKLKRLGNAFSTEAAIEARFPQLIDSVRAVRELCDDDTAAPFEKNQSIKSLTDWLVSHVMQSAGTSIAPLVFFHRTFGVPKAETLLFVSDLSVVMYERSLNLAAISGMLALWLGYSDTKFLSQFAESVFCEAVGRYRDIDPADISGAVSDEQRLLSLELLTSGRVPGVLTGDHRFHCMMAQRREVEAAGDELVGIVEFARWLLLDPGVTVDGSEGKSRVARKLGRRLAAADLVGEKAAA